MSDTHSHARYDLNEARIDVHPAAPATGEVNDFTGPVTCIRCGADVKGSINAIDAHSCATREAPHPASGILDAQLDKAKQLAATGEASPEMRMAIRNCAHRAYVAGKAFLKSQELFSEAKPLAISAENALVELAASLESQVAALTKERDEAQGLFDRLLSQPTHTEKK